MGYWGVKNLGYGILGVKNLGYGILGGKKSGIWDMGTPVSAHTPDIIYIYMYTVPWYSKFVKNAVSDNVCKAIYNEPSSPYSRSLEYQNLLAYFTCNWERLYSDMLNEFCLHPSENCLC